MRNITKLKGIALAAVIFSVTAVTSSTARLSAENVIDLADLVISTVNGDRLHNGRAYTGIAREYDSVGAMLREEQFVAGRRHGHVKMWFRNSQPAFHSVYVDGRREGLTQSWWSNGQPRGKTWFVNDEPHGVAQSWYSSGEKYKRYQYNHGEPTGLQQAWRKNGKLFSNFEYRNGRAFGLRNSNLCVELDDEAIKFN